MTGRTARKGINGTRGVPVGYDHNWTYRGHWKERKVKPGLWKIDFIATKRTGKRGKGGPKKGFAIKWGIKAIQTAIKTRRGEYQTRMVGTKKMLKSGYKGVR